MGENPPPTTQALLNAHALSMIKTAINAEMDEEVSKLTVTGEEIDEGKLLGMTQEELVKKLKPQPIPCGRSSSHHEGDCLDIDIKALLT